MLQQTQVSTVIPYYQRFLSRFPTVQALARAPAAEVFAQWRGLGYYARARALHRAASRIVESGGSLPRSAEALRALPGFGRYTAGAVASIAFGERTPIVDGNVARVLARWRAVEGDIRSNAVRDQLWDIADGLVPEKRPGDFNQALMELGALVCTPRAPACLLCPVTASCQARRRGLQDRIPNKIAVRARHRLVLSVALVRRGSCILVARRAEKGLFGGLWELPSEPDDGRGVAALEQAVRSHVGLRLRVGPLLAEVHRTLTHRDLELRVYRCRKMGGRLAPTGNYVQAAFKSLSELGSLGMATAMASAIAEATRRR
jgi:A/G-specific adenine glycosylase